MITCAACSILNNTLHRFTLIAHCLTYILEACPHHPTLLNALLEVCLSHCLASEAYAVLAALFTVSILPRPSSPSFCPLTHPAHKNFLTSLREMCTGSGHSMSIDHTTHVINDRTFTRVFVDTLSKPCPEQIPAWTSKAVVRLAREYRQQDFPGCFIPLVAGLASCLAQNNGTRKKAPSKSSKIPDTMQSNLRDEGLERLAKWVVSMLDVLHTATSGAEELCACVDFLVDVERLGFHIVAAAPASPPACVAEALCCLAAYCLSSPLTPQLPGVDFSLPILEQLLRSAQVKNQTFDGLVSHIFPLPTIAVYKMPLSEVGDDTCTPPPSALTMNDRGVGAIDALALPLRTRGLLRCEVALYRGALEHVEALIAAPPHTLPPTFPMGQQELAKLRLELLDKAEDAERRCYGNPSDPSQPPGGGEWMWEEMVGSWVMKSPAPVQAKRMAVERVSKRRRTEADRPSVASSSRASQPQPVSRRSTGSNPPLPEGMCTASGSSASSISGKRTVHTATARTSKRVSFALDKENFSDSDGDNYHDLGTDPLISGETDTTPVPKRSRNFATILADAHMNAISLRAEREVAAKAKAKPRASAPPRVFAVPESPASATPLLQRRVNFATLLADSHRNVISLREERERERARAEALRNSSGMGKNDAGHKRKRHSYTYGRPSPEEEDEEDEDKPAAGTHEDVLAVEPESSPVRPGNAFQAVEPSSDDLNLFAYPDSSPVAPRRFIR